MQIRKSVGVVRVTCLFIIAKSALSFSFGVRALTEMKICICLHVK